MWQKNNGIGEINTLQNRFTKYLMTSIKRDKAKYLAKRSKVGECEVSTDPHRIGLTDVSIHQVFDGIMLEQILNQISERERYILLSRILDNRDFEDLAKELGIGYKGIYSVYCRTLQKLRCILEGDST